MYIIYAKLPPFPSIKCIEDIAIWVILSSGFSSYNIDKTFWCDLLSGTTSNVAAYLGQYCFCWMRIAWNFVFCHILEFLKTSWCLMIGNSTYLWWSVGDNDYLNYLYCYSKS